MNYEALLELNKTALFDKLDLVQRVGNLYVANDIIEALSNQKERDKRLINDYNSDEVQTYKIKRGKLVRLVRMLTIQGIARFLSEGKLYDQKNACLYFKVELPKKDVFAEELSKCEISDNVYTTNKLLKWLFQKRKMCKELGPTTTITDVLSVFADNPDADQDRLKYLTKKQEL